VAHAKHTASLTRMERVFHVFSRYNLDVSTWSEWYGSKITSTFQEGLYYFL